MQDPSDQPSKPAEPVTEPDTLSRRQFITTGSAVLATAALAAAAVQAQVPTPANVSQAEHDASAGDPGPKNPPIATASPSSETPPPTDSGDVQSFWYSFSLAHKRVQEGGWARQVNVKDLPLSTEIAGVNMRLESGGVRELHWHATGEWALMLTGSARLTAIDAEGCGYVNDVTAGDLWYFPLGLPHSIQGLGPDGCEFLLVFDQGTFSEFDTTLLDDWVAHTPKDVLAKNWNVPESALAGLPRGEKYIFPAPLPGSLEDDKRAVAGKMGLSPVRFDFPMHSMTPTKQTASGNVKIVDSTLFPVSTTIAAALVTVKPGGMREMHWHQNSDEWQYYVQGQARMTLFANGAKARTTDFRAGDVGVVPKTFGHYIENTGTTDLIFLETFKSDRYQDVSLSEWLRRTPPQLVRSHLSISQATLDAIPAEKLVIVPG